MEKYDVKFKKKFGQNFLKDKAKELYIEVQNLTFEGNYQEYLQALVTLNPAVTKFFDDVLVMDNDEKIKNNRLALLNELRKRYIILTDFSKLNG